MSNRLSILTAPLLVIALLGALLGVALLSTFPSTGQNKRDVDLEKIRTEITRARKNLEALQARAQTTSEQLEAIELQLSIQQGELELARNAQRSLQEEQAVIGQQIAGLERRIVVEKQHLSTRLVTLYKMGALSYLRLLLSMDSRENPFEAAAMLTYLVNRDSRAVAQFQSTRQSLDTRRALLREKEMRLARAARLVADRQQSMVTTRSEKEKRLAVLQFEGSRAAQRITQLEEKARRLQNLLGVLYGQAKAPRSGARIEELRGALDWPLQGKVLESFGKHRNLKFATVTVNNGLKIEAAPGTDVRAVFQGTVLYAQWFKGYGNLVIIDHGNRIFSLYGNTQLPRVSVGDRVAAKQLVATASGDEEGTSGYLYFEIREDNKPQDPRTWLR